MRAAQRVHRLLTARGPALPRTTTRRGFTVQPESKVSQSRILDLAQFADDQKADAMVQHRDEPRCIRPRGGCEQ